MGRKVDHDENIKGEMIMKPLEEAVLKDMSTTKKDVNKGTWTAEEDRKLAEVIAIHGTKRWKIIAAKAGFLSFSFSFHFLVLYTTKMEETLYKWLEWYLSFDVFLGCRSQ